MQTESTGTVPVGLVFRGYRSQEVSPTGPGAEGEFRSDWTCGRVAGDLWTRRGSSVEGLVVTVKTRWSLSSTLYHRYGVGLSTGTENLDNHDTLVFWYSTSHLETRTVLVPCLLTVTLFRCTCVRGHILLGLCTRRCRRKGPCGVSRSR